jgi:hypothetical protein
MDPNSDVRQVAAKILKEIRSKAEQTMPN